MRFWDSSAIVPLCVTEERTPEIEEIARSDESIAVWWETVLECQSAFARLRREAVLPPRAEDAARARLAALATAWTVMEPTDELRALAGQLLLRHPLRSADSLQLAAAVHWAGRAPAGLQLVSLDDRLREAAHGEGFAVVP